MLARAHLASGGTSKNMQTGKAGEHLVCANLILQGYTAFLTDAGMPYDVIVVLEDGRLLRVQVRSVSKPYVRSRSDKHSSYKFGLRKGRHYSRIGIGTIDVFAFVALDRMIVAYVRADELVARDGKRLVSAAEFCDDSRPRSGFGARVFEKCSAFPVEPSDRSKKACFRCGDVYPATAKFFTRNKRCSGGIGGVCRVCTRKLDNAAKKKKRGKKR